MQRDLDAAAEAGAVDRGDASGTGARGCAPKSSCPARLPSLASSRVEIFGNSSMSAPAEKTKGLPVSTIATQLPDSSSRATPGGDSNAAAAEDGRFVRSSPLSIVTSASGPALGLDAVQKNAVGSATRFSHSSAAPIPMPMQSAVSP